MQKLKNLLFTLPLIFTACLDDVEENSVCGDGIIEGNEECDGESDCNEHCYLDRYIFLTEKSYQGNLGGIGMADNACTTESKEFGNTDQTRFRAIIGTDESSPIKRLKKHKGRIVTLRGKVVAEEGLEDLFDGSLLSPINETPFETDINDYVFTGINQSPSGGIRNKFRVNRPGPVI